MSTRPPPDLPSPAPADTRTCPHIGTAPVSAPAQSDMRRTQAAVPPTYRHGHASGYPQPYAATRPHATPSAPQHVRTSAYPKVYT